MIILSYRFPPYEGVGARRWSKFVEYMSQANIQIHVVTANWKKTEKQIWEIESKENIHIHILVNPFYSLKMIFPWVVRIFNKLEYLIDKWFGMIDDSHLYYILNQKKIEQIIKKNQISHIIATCPPYTSVYFATKLKVKYPHIKLINDFRDTWTDDYFSWNRGDSESHPTFKKQIKMEAFCLNNCDAVVAVTEGLMKRLEVKIVNPRVQKCLIHNGYDERDFCGVETPYPHNYLDKKYFNISHFGTLSFGRDTEFFNFFDFLSAKMDSDISGKIKFNFFGSIDEVTKKKLMEHPLSCMIEFRDFIPPKEIQPVMLYSDMHLVVNDSVFFYAIGSKIFDAFLYKKPVLVISKRDYLHNLINTNNIGFATDNSKEENNDVLLKLKKYVSNENAIKFNTEFDYSVFSIRELANSYLELLNKV